jgi:hypothetical protein
MLEADGQDQGADEIEALRNRVAALEREVGLVRGSAVGRHSIVPDDDVPDTARDAVARLKAVILDPQGLVDVDRLIERTAARTSKPHLVPSPLSHPEQVERVRQGVTEFGQQIEVRLVPRLAGRRVLGQVVGGVAEVRGHAGGAQQVDATGVIEGDAGSEHARKLQSVAHERCPGPRRDLSDCAWANPRDSAGWCTAPSVGARRG